MDEDWIAIDAAVDVQPHPSDSIKINGLQKEFLLRRDSPLPESAARPPDPDLWPQPFPVLSIQFAQVRLQRIRHLPAHLGWDSLPVIATAEPCRIYAPLDELKDVKDPSVEALKFLLNVIEHQERVIRKLTNKPRI